MNELALELEVDRLEAMIAREVSEAARGLWVESGARPEAGLPAEPPVLVAETTRRVLDRARALAGEPGARAAALWRLAIGATAAAQDPARARAPAARSEAGLRAAAATRAQVATRLGFADAWALAREVAGEADEDGVGARTDDDHDHGHDHEALGAIEPVLAGVLADPARLVATLATTRGVDPAVIAIEVRRAPAPLPGRTFVIEPGRDVRVRVWWRPEASARGALRVLLHELGHALLAASWRDRPWALAAPRSRADDEGAAAQLAGLLEREAFAVDVLGLPRAAAQRLAGAERAARVARRARLIAAAEAERAFVRAGGPAPWREHLAWTEPGASWSYARAEDVRDALDLHSGVSCAVF